MKNISLLLTFLLIFIVSCSKKEEIEKNIYTNSSNIEANIKNEENFIYKNEDLWIEINLPKSWKDLKINNDSKNIYFYDEFNNNFGWIVVLNKEQYKKYIECENKNFLKNFWERIINCELTKEQFLEEGKNNNYFFVGLWVIELEEKAQKYLNDANIKKYNLEDEWKDLINFYRKNITIKK